MPDMVIPDTNTENTTTTTTSAGSKRTINGKTKDKDDSASVAKKNDEDDYDIFSEESKIQLSTRVSQCQCGGFRICLPCFEEYMPTLVDRYPAPPTETDTKTDNKTDNNTHPVLCQRDCEDGSHCTDDYTSLPVFPCTVCKRMEDGGEVTTDWHLDCEQAVEAICDHNICPDCLGVIVDDVCKVCKKNCDI